MAESFTVEQSLERQAVSCALAGSPLYATLLEGLLEDYRLGGLTAELLDGVTDQPVHDAISLRYLATAHLLALTGRAPGVAAHYSSCGGNWDGDPAVVAEFLATVRANRDEFVFGVRRNVQTNEVGRAPALVAGFAEISSRYRMPLDQLEIGSSAGLLSRWDHFAYDSGTSRVGTPESPLRFGPEWWTDRSPDLSRTQQVRRRRACDISPIDLSSAAGRQTMLSFIWPDQVARIERLRAALAVAERVPITIDRADAADWLAKQLADGPALGAITVLFHSIVWQYLPRPTKDGIRAVLDAAGSVATSDNPLCWLRMEPSSPESANVRLTTWPGGETELLAEVGYHGAEITWLA
jgi:hypothetical protein